MALDSPAELRQAIQAPDWPHHAQQHLASARHLARGGAHARAQQRANNTARALANSSLAVDLAHASGLALARALARDLARANASDLAHALAVDLARDLAVDRASARARALARDLAVDLAVDRASALDRAGLGPLADELLAFFDWVGSIVYGLVEFARADPDDTVTSPAAGSSRAVLSPADDERIAFERLWSIVQQALDDDKLPDHVADEIRALNKLLDIVRHELDPDRYTDLFDLISNRLSRLLPDVHKALLGSGEPPPQSLQTLDAPVEEQLDAVTVDLEAAAAAYEAAVEQIDPDTVDQDYQLPPPRVLPPYAEDWAKRFNHVCGRIDTLRAMLAQTKTGRQILRAVGTGATGVAAAGTAAVVGVAGVGAVAAVGVGSAAAATIVIGVAQWLYTRIRRQHPDLPPMNLPPDPPDAPQAP
jgi:hypothetical protein